MKRIILITSKEYWVEALENKEYNNINNIDFAKDIISKIEEAINFTDSCEIVKDKKPMNFEEWAKTFGYKETYKGNFTKRKITYSREAVHSMYYTEYLHQL